MRTAHSALRIALASVALFAGLPILRAQTDSDDIPALRAQVNQLDQQLRILERKLELKEAAAAAQAKAAPKVGISDRGFVFASGDGADFLHLGGLVQFDSRLFFNDSGLVNNSFVLRRARLIAEGGFGQLYAFQVVPEFGGTTPSLLDANLTAAPAGPRLQFKFGRFKAPLGLELLQSDSVTFFAERSLATNLVPNRDLGVQAGGALAGGALTYAAGIFNGVADAASTANADFDNDKEVDARVFAQPFRNDAESFLQGLGFGVAASAGREKGAAGVTAGYKTDGQQTFFKYRSSVVADGGVWRVSPQAYYYHGPFGALGEYVVSTVNARPAAAAPKSSLQNRAWQLAAGYVLTGENAAYTGVTPREPFNWKNGTWGAWQIAVRYAELKIDPRAFPLFADPAANANAASALGFGVNWYLSRTVRASLDYFRTHFTLNVPAPSAPLLRQDENALLTRLQVSF